MNQSVFWCYFEFRPLDGPPAHGFASSSAYLEFRPVDSPPLYFLKLSICYKQNCYKQNREVKILSCAFSTERRY